MVCGRVGQGLALKGAAGPDDFAKVCACVFVEIFDELFCGRAFDSKGREFFDEVHRDTGHASQCDDLKVYLPARLPEAVTQGGHRGVTSFSAYGVAVGAYNARWGV